MSRIEGDDVDLLVRTLGLSPQKHARLARRLAAIGGLFGLWHAGSEAVADLLAPSEVRRLEALIRLAGRLLSPSPLPRLIDGPERLVAYLAPRMVLEPVESFWVVALDARGRPKGAAPVARGTLTACLIHPREVFHHALRAGAASIIAAHNHPSGDPVPSDDDYALTERLTEAGEIMGIPLLDHLIIAKNGFVSIGPVPRLRPVEVNPDGCRS